MSPLHHHFPGQKENERVQLLVRKHWITEVKSALIIAVMGGLPIAVGFAFGGLLWEKANPTLFWGFIIAFLIYILFVSLTTYIHWLNDELDIIVVTDQRIVSQEQIDLFHRQISEANVSQIQDVTGIENGFFQTLFHYGSLEITTASNDTFFKMDHVERPHETARHLLDICGKLSPSKS